MSNVSISEETVEQLKRMLRGRVTDLRIVMREDHLVLLGSATNYHGKQLAQHYVLKALGFTRLVNEIEVRQIAPHE
jgi:hypothetical protein